MEYHLKAVVRWISALCVICVIGGSVTEVSAQNKPDLSIEWLPENHCGSQESLESEIVHILGDSWSGDTPERFIVAIQQKNSAYTVQIDVVHEQEVFSRRVTVQSCDLAIKVTGLLIVLTVDPALLMSLDEPELIESIAIASQAESVQAAKDLTESPSDGPADGAGIQPTGFEGLNELSTVPAVRETGPNSQPSQKGIPTVEIIAESLNPLISDYSWVLGAAFVTNWGDLPVFGMGLMADASFIFSRFRAAAALGYYFPREDAISGIDRGKIQASMLEGTVGLGMTLEWRNFRFNPLGGGGLNVLWADTMNIVQSQSGYATYFFGWISLMTEVTISRGFGIYMAPTGKLPFTQPRFEVEGIGLVHQPSGITAELKVGIFYLF